MALAFPPGFLWGVATAAYQVEGSPEADGKGPSIWDAYCRIPGKIRRGHSGDVACDHYRRFRDDVAIMRDLGVKAYRFSISWPRIVPDGDGAVNPAGLDFYSRLVDALLDAGIAPFPTLYHWDLPLALQERFGGWQGRETAHAFGRYAGIVAAALGDRVRHIFTINEFHSFVEMGHRGIDMVVQGRDVRIELAPGLKLERAALATVRHHAVLGHGLAVQAIRAAAPAMQVGPAENIAIAIPAIATPEHVAAAEAATRALNAAYLGVMLEGRYADSYLEALGADAPGMAPGDLAAISAPVDFLGLNVFRPQAYVLADGQGGWRELGLASSHPRMDSTWHLVDPEALYWAPRLADSLWGRRPIFITENGCATRDVAAPDGSIDDCDRVMYLRATMAALNRAIADGADVRGNFFWSAMDNFEWSDGYGRRFGLVHVDYDTQRRTPRLSAHWFRACAAANALL